MDKIIKILEEKLNPKYENHVFTWVEIKNALISTEDEFDLVPIKVNNNTYFVKPPVITLGQIKRLVGADNSHYRVVVMNIPEEWKNKRIGDDDYLNITLSDCDNIEFKVVE